MDIRTPDENTLSRRAQTSRGSDQTAFVIDVERDLVRGVAGAPKDPAFGSYVAGTDVLTLHRKLQVCDLVSVCEDIYATYEKVDYRGDFGWIDKILHIRDQALIEKLDAKLVAALARAMDDGGTDRVHLAFPVIMDSEKSSSIRYKGFRSDRIYIDLDLLDYLDALKERRKTGYSGDYLNSHNVHQVDDEGRDCGGKWKVRDCFVFETDLNGHTYVLSGGYWYRVDQRFAKEVQEFFDTTPRMELPKAEAGENEETYNKRISDLDKDMICLDRRLIESSGALTLIEVCDFPGRERHLIHVKDKKSSSRLSHLFSQGVVSAHVLTFDPASRDRIREKVIAVQNETGQKGYEEIIPAAGGPFSSSDFTVVFGVMVAEEDPKLPFFSLVSFRQAGRALRALGYKFAFSWIEKPRSGVSGRAKRGPRNAAAARPSSGR